MNSNNLFKPKIFLRDYLTKELNKKADKRQLNMQCFIIFICIV